MTIYDALQSAFRYFILIQVIMEMKDEAYMKKTLYRLEIYYKQHATESEPGFRHFHNPTQ